MTVALSIAALFVAGVEAQHFIGSASLHRGQRIHL
jgi:hypothetical protein